MIGANPTTNARIGQDIAFPRSSVFQRDPTFDAYRRGRFRRGTGKPFGVPGARVTGPELGDIGDAIGGGQENIGSGGPAFPGGTTPTGTFTPPPPFPAGPPGPSQPSEIDRAIALGRTILGGARQVNRLVDLLTPPDQGTQPMTPGFAEQRAGERQDFTGNELGDLADNLRPVLGGAQVVEPALPSGGEIGVDVGQGNPPTPTPGLGNGQIPEPGLPSGGELGVGFDLGSFDLGNITSGLELPPSAGFNPGEISTPGLPSGGEIREDFNAAPPAQTGTAGEGAGVGLGDVAAGVVAAANIAQTAMGDRPDIDKAAIASGYAAQLGLSLAGETSAAEGIGVALNAAMLGESLASGKTGGEAGDVQGRQTVSLIGSVVGLVFPMIGLVVGIGMLVDYLAREFEEERPPLGSNWTDYKSIMIGKQLQQALPTTINKATNPLQLLGLAIAGPALAPHEEVQISHDTWGFGGDWDDPPSQDLVQNLQRIAQTGDPDLLRQFITGVHVKVGGGGATQEDYLLTDLYRRTLVSLLPANHPVRQEAERAPNNLFGATPEGYTPAYLANQRYYQNTGNFYGTPNYGYQETGEGTSAPVQTSFTPYSDQEFQAQLGALNPLTPLYRRPEELQVPQAQMQGYLDYLAQLRAQQAEEERQRQQDRLRMEQVGYGFGVG